MEPAESNTDMPCICRRVEISEEIPLPPDQTLTTTDGLIPFHPTMAFTSAAQGSEVFVASASSFYAPNREMPFKAFSSSETSAIPGSDTNQWTTGIASYETGNFTGTYSCCCTSVDGIVVEGEWLQLQCSKPHVLNSFSITANYWNPVRAPKSFVLAGSEDGVIWAVLHAEQEVGEWSSKQTRHFTVSSDYAARYFRLITTAVHGTQSWLTIDKLRLYEDSARSMALSARATD